jgi:hypothetical protein
MATRFDFQMSQCGAGEAEPPVQSTYVIHFREIDFSAFLLLSSPLQLPGKSPSDVALEVLLISMIVIARIFFFFFFFNLQFLFFTFFSPKI